MSAVRSFLAVTLSVFPLLSMFAMPPRADVGNLFGSAFSPLKLMTRNSHTPYLTMIKQRDSWDSEYDFIVIGGGSAGAVVANRLSEDFYTKVLLLEAGGNENLISDIPLAFTSLQQTPMDWNYVTEPQRAACFGHKGRVSNSSSSNNNNNNNNNNKKKKKSYYTI